MSNPAVYLLAENEIHGNHLRIEDNRGEAIHIHYGDLRVSLTIKEFDEFYESVYEAAEKLLALEGIKLSEFDLSCFDWNWLERYELIERIEKKKKKVGDLYTQYRIRNKEYLSKLVNIKDSPFIDALHGKDQYLQRYKEVTKFGQNSTDRLHEVYQFIRNNGYPVDDQYIMVDGNGVIYDGDHRAACLYELYGGEYEIPVLEVSFRDEVENIQTAIRYNRHDLIPRLLKKTVRDGLHMIWNVPSGLKRKIKKGVSWKQPGREIAIGDLINLVNENGIHYYLMDCSANIPECSISYQMVVDSFEGVKEVIKTDAITGYRDYLFLYSTPAPIIVKCRDGNLLIWDRLCGKSRFEQDILPLDKYCNQYAWRHISENGRGWMVANTQTILLYRITRSLLESQEFSPEDRFFIEQHRDCLDDEVVRELFQKEFFLYTDHLLQQLKASRYEEAIEDYLHFVDY